MVKTLLLVYSIYFSRASSQRSHDHAGPCGVRVHTELTRSVLAQGSGSLVAAVPTQLTQLRGPGLATADVIMPAWAFLLWPGWPPVCCLA